MTLRRWDNFLTHAAFATNFDGVLNQQKQTSTLILTPAVI